jgi:hypothetical protein
VVLARASIASHLFPISASQNATNARTGLLRVIGLQISRHGDGTNLGTVHSIKLDHAARPTCPGLPLFSESRHCLKALASDVSSITKLRAANRGQLRSSILIERAQHRRDNLSGRRKMDWRAGPVPP